MAVNHSKNLQVFVAQYDLTSYFRTVQVDGEQAMHDTTVFGNTAPTCIPGLENAKIAVEGLFDSTLLLGSDVALPALLSATTASPVTVAKQGTTIGNRVHMIYALEQNYKLGSKVGDLVVNMADFQSNDGYDSGVSLHQNVAETASTNSTSVDNTVLTSNGAVAFLHVTAVSGTTPSAIIKVQHSANNSTWADLATFTTATVVISDRQVIAASTTVNRYLRVISTITGTTPSFTYTVGVSRR